MNNLKIGSMLELESPNSDNAFCWSENRPLSIFFMRRYFSETSTTNQWTSKTTDHSDFRVLWGSKCWARSQ